VHQDKVLVLGAVAETYHINHRFSSRYIGNYLFTTSRE